MNNDTISRQAAIDALERIFNQCEEIEAHLPDGDPDKTGYKMFPDYMTVWKYLHQLPSAERREVQSSECKYWDDESNFCTLNRPSAERRGQWVSQEYMSEIDSFIYTEYKCSNCGEISKKKSNYCPNCGARMDGEEK